jgi:hypothetical protein
VPALDPPGVHFAMFLPLFDARLHPAAIVSRI